MTTPSDPSKKPAPDPKSSDAIGHDHPGPRESGEDSSVDLGHPVSGDPHGAQASGSQSGISVVDWASLVDDVPPPPPPAESSSIDVSSDAEFFFPGLGTEQPAPAAEATMQVPAEAAHAAQEATFQASTEELEQAAAEPAQPVAEEPSSEIEATFIMPVAEPRIAAEPAAPVAEEPEYETEATMNMPAAEALSAQGPEEVVEGEEATIVFEASTAAGDSAIHALLAEAPDVAEAPPASGVIEAEIDFEPDEEQTIIPEPQPASEMAQASGVIEAEIDFEPDVEETIVPAPQSASDMAQAEAAAFATPEEMVEDKVFTPETMFAEPDSSILRQTPPVPKMELDSGRKLDDVVELGADSIVTGQSGVDLSGVIPEVVEEDEAVVAEVAEESGVGGQDVLAEIAEVEEVEVAEVAEEEVLELGAEALASDSAVDLAEVVPEVVESDVAVEPPMLEAEETMAATEAEILAEPASGLDLAEVVPEVVESDVSVEPPLPVVEDTEAQTAEAGVLKEPGSDIDLGGSAADDGKPISSGDVVMEADVADAGSSGRDFIAEAVESGIDGTLALPAMDVEEFEATLVPPDSGKKVSPPPVPGNRETEVTREIEIPVPQPEPDDFFTPSEAAVISEEGEVVLGDEVDEEVTTASESSSIDLGSLPELPVLPSASQVPSEVHDIDLNDVEDAATASQREVGKASPQGEIDLGPPSSASSVTAADDVFVEEAAVVADDADVDFTTMADVVPGSSGVVIGSGVAMGEITETEPTADLDLGEPGSGVIADDAVVEEGVVDEEEVVEGGVVEDDEELEGAVVGDDEDETPTQTQRAPVAPKGGFPWFTTIGSTAFGALIVGGLVVSGVVDKPLKSARDALGTSPKPTADSGNKVAPVGDKSPAADLLAHNDYKGAREAAERIANNEEKNFLLGQIEFREYAANQARVAGNDEPKLAVDGAKSAIEKLESAKTAKAYFELGQIYELSGDTESAKKNYDLGIAACKSEPEKRKFQAAINRLELQKVSALPRPGRQLDVQLALLSLLVFAPEDGADTNDEAGYAFWDAIKALNGKDYKTALDQLEAARKAHLKGRLLRRGQQQNPGSDPTEEIFLNCIKQLTVYWTLEKDYKDKGGIKDALANAGKGLPKELIDKIKDMKNIDKEEEIAKAVSDLLKVREDLAKRLDAKEPKDYDAAINEFLKKDGGYDQLAKSNALLLDVAKAAGVEKDKLDTLEKTVVAFAADGALVAKLGEKLKTDKFIEDFKSRDDLAKGVDSLAKQVPDLTKQVADAKKDLDTTKMELVATNAFVRQTYDVLAVAEIFKPVNKDDPLPPTNMILDAAEKTILLVRDKMPIVVVLRENAELMGYVESVVTWSFRYTDELTKQHKDEITKLTADQAAVVAGLKKTITDVEGTLAKVKTDNEAALTKLKKDHADSLMTVRTPQQMMPYWLALLEIRDNKEFAAATAEAVQKDAKFVLDAPGKTKEEEARAKVLQVLALRNLGKYDEARKVFEDEKDLPKEGMWGAAVAEALLESKNVVSYFGKKADELADHIYPEKALELIDRMLAGAAAEQKGYLLAKRSLLKLEMAIAGGRAVEITDDLVKQALADAKGAGPDVAHAHYALGRIYEELKDIDLARKEYDQAVNLHKDKDADGYRYEAALSRILAAPRIGPRRPAELPKDVKIGRRDRDDEAETLALSPSVEQQLALILLTVMLEPPAPAARCPWPMPFFPIAAAADPEAPVGVPPLTEDEKRARALAQSILAADPPAPWDARAEALAVLGRHTEALLLYAEGIQKDKLMRAERAAALLRIIKQNPRLSPKAPAGSNPLEAEIHFSNGLRSYYAGRYADAEKHFQATVDAVDGDDEKAHYFYFLGLAQLGQGKRQEMSENVAFGAVLERRGLPSRVAINASLERIQGELRKILDEERKRLPGP